MNDHTSSGTANGETISRFGYELIREVLLPELLGKDAPELLYWAGKLLARKYPLATIDEITAFFSKASWGSLTVKKETKHELEFELTAVLLASRVPSKAESFYQLEAGFLAQQIEMMKGVAAETYEHPVKKAGIASFTVKWDRKDHI